LLGGFVLAAAALLPEAWGRETYDTKLDLITNPTGLLSHLLNLWDPVGWFGWLQDQYQGYAFPDAPFFALGHFLAIPPWLLQRAWMAALITVAFWGAVRLAEAFDIGSTPTRLISAVVFALWPTFTILVGPNSTAIAPGVLLPWVLIPLVKGAKRGSPVRAAALSALAVLFMGGVNAADTLYVLVMPALFLLTRRASPRRRALMGWWVVCVGLAIGWWLIPLLFLGKYGFNFLPYVEQSITTTSTMSVAATLSGMGDWTAYLNVGRLAWEPGGLTLVSLPVPLLGTAVVTAAGLYGLARRDIRERRFLVITVAIAMVVMTAGYWGPLGGPFGSVLRPTLNAALAPLRNVYKVEPVLALALVIGLAHALQVTRERLNTVRSRTVLSHLVAACLLSLSTPYLVGRALEGHSFSSVPAYWYSVANYLAKHAPQTTALVLPAAAHGFYVWGWPVDEPLESLARSSWVDRETVPYGGAASARMVDAIEQGFRTNLPQPGLSALLRRSGVSYVVVQNDTQWQLSDSPSPFVINNVLALSKGFQWVKSFGPELVTAIGNNPTLSIEPTAFHARFKSVEIFRVNGSAGPVSTYPLSTAALVSGGPEALLQLLNQNALDPDQASILAGNWPGGTYRGPLWAITDTLRRTDVRFGLVNDNVSYTYTATQSAPGGGPPHQMLPFPGVEHQTVAVYTGAGDITASSSGSSIFSLPEYDPANVFDGNSNGWIAGSGSGAVGQWIQINFDHPIDPDGAAVQLLVKPGLPLATALKVSTNRGSVITTTSQTTRAQPLKVAAGSASWLRVTIEGVNEAVAGGPEPGIQAITIPGVHVALYLKPPEESVGQGAKNVVFSFAATQVDPEAVLRLPPEQVMSRVFTTERAMQFAVSGSVLPRKGVALDDLISATPTGPPPLSIAATSTFDNLPNLRPQNLVDGNVATNWVSEGRDATLTLRWPRLTTLTHLVLHFAISEVAAKPEKILLRTPSGATRALTVPTSRDSAKLTFPALTTDVLYVSFPKVADTFVTDALGGSVLAPVGLAELDFPALAKYQMTPPVTTEHFSAACGSGPPVTIDGISYPTSLTGTYGALENLDPLALKVCGVGAVYLGAGTHHLVTPSAGPPFTITGLKLNSEPPSDSSASASMATAGRATHVLKWGPENRTLRIAPGATDYLEVHENYDVGWAATLGGKQLRPIVLDGWQQGFIVPAGDGGIVHLTFKPEGFYLISLAVGAFGVLILLGLLFFGRRLRRASVALPDAVTWRRPVSRWAVLVLVTAGVFVIGGPIAVAVPALFFVGRWRQDLLPCIAAGAMVVAGVVSAINPGTGAHSGVGAFSPYAQMAAVVAVAAVLVPAGRLEWFGRSRRHARPSTDDDPG
jgi:arabinofuranan 3-O-arabinosyltransferase